MDIKVSIKDPKVLKRPVADLMFVMDAKEMAEILKDSHSIKLIELLSSGKIQIYGLIDKLKLIDKGYTSFLNRLGLN